MSGVRVDNLNAWYENHQILDSISLEAERGSALGLVGPSGSGKSSTLKAIAGVLPPHTARYEGRIWIGGKDVTTLPPERRDAPLVYQQLHLFEMSVEENVKFGLRCRGVSHSETSRRAAAVMDRLGLSALRRRSVTALSGGERQRVAVARAVILRPKVLLLDEAWNALDRPLRSQVIECLREIQKDFGTTVVFASHDQQQTLEFADQVVVLRNGRITQAGTPDEVYWWPVDTNVGEALGPFNRVMGTLETDTSGARQVRLGLAGFLSVIVHPRSKLPQADGRVLVGVRPSAVSLSAPQSDNSGLIAVVSARRHEGEQLTYDLQLSGCETHWQASLKCMPGHRPTHFGVGDTVGLHVDPALVVIYPEKGEP